MRFQRLRAISAAARPSGSFLLIGLALVIGLVTGVLVAIVKRTIVEIQQASLGYMAERSEPPTGHIAFPRLLAALCGGALCVAFLGWLFDYLDNKAWHEKEAPIDAVEANALRGGLMHSRDGVSVVAPILGSVGFGASVGIEAAVTQIGAVLASLLGQRQHLPRSDMRLLVGAGVAAAISAAYNAPIAGMLYAFELVLGSYSTRMLAPVGLAAIASSLLERAIQGGGKTFDMEPLASVQWPDYPLAVIIGCVAAGVGIATMVLASSCERVLKRWFRKTFVRLLAGAVVMAVLAEASPYVLGSGHSGIDAAVGGKIVGISAFTLLVLKVAASAVSLGSGFRGGLFSASLLIGSLMGHVVAAIAALMAAQIAGMPSVQVELCAAIGMASVAASIIGSPLAMIFLVIEVSRSPEATVIIALGAVTASFLTARLFGYSFATWRFQQRGLALEGGTDVTRLSAVTIKDLVRPPKRSVLAEADLAHVMHAMSVAGARGTAVYTQNGHFIGLVDPELVAECDPDEALPVVASDLVYESAPNVTIETTLAEVIEIFRTDDRATIAVLDESDTKELVGCVRARDAYAAASARLDTQKREDLGVD